MDKFFEIIQNANRDTKKILNAFENPTTARIDPADTPFAKQAELLNRIASNTEAIEAQANELKRIADAAEQQAQSAKERADLAKQQAEEAKKEARWANIKSWAAGIIAVISLAGMLLADAKPIMESVRRVISLLGF